MFLKFERAKTHCFWPFYINHPTWIELVLRRRRLTQNRTLCSSPTVKKFSWIALTAGTRTARCKTRAGAFISDGRRRGRCYGLRCFLFQWKDIFGSDYRGKDRGEVCGVARNHSNYIFWRCYGRFWGFQQNSCPIHVSQLSKNWLRKFGIRLMDWRSRSTDLKLISNLCNILGKQVYRGRRQFVSVEEVFERVRQCWAEISGDIWKFLVLSM